MYLFIDERAGLFRYAAAGHPPMLHLARSGGGVRALEKNGLALGFMPAANYDELERPLDGGERWLLYTDGLIEAANAADDFYGLERLEPAFAAAAAQPLEAAAEGLLRSVDAWSGSPPPTISRSCSSTTLRVRFQAQREGRASSFARGYGGPP